MTANSDDVRAQAFKLRSDGASTKAIAEQLGVPRTTVRNWFATQDLKDAARKGEHGTEPVLPGFEISRTTAQSDDTGAVKKQWVTQKPERGGVFVMPEGQVLKEVSAYVDGEGRLNSQWIKTKAGVDAASFFDDVSERFKTFEPAAIPVSAPDLDYLDQIALFPWADPHFGVFSWGKETGTDWDLSIAVKTIKETFRTVVQRTPATKRSILLVGGDTLHADSNENKTAKSGNALQVDGRYPKVMLTACETIADTTTLILTRSEEVEIIILPGNHDEHSSYAIAFFLHAWFRNDPRVVVDISPSLFRFREFGKTMLGTTHGHTAKIKDMPSIMAAREAAMWGRTVHRYVHGFHVHHRSQTVSEGGGCTTETHPIIAPQDAWHYGAGFLSGRSQKSILYDPEHGEVSRITVAVT